MQTVRFRVDLSPKCSIGPGKIALLETIAQTGSIRRAADVLGMSYRQAWLLVDDLNHSFTEQVTQASVGGAGGGGVELTPFGEDLVRRYRAAAKRIESFARSEFDDLASKARKGPDVKLNRGRRALAKRKIAARRQ
jgi:molybdate transport system regulatory protein